MSLFYYYQIFLNLLFLIQLRNIAADKQTLDGEIWIKKSTANSQKVSNEMFYVMYEMCLHSSFFLRL